MAEYKHTYFSMNFGTLPGHVHVSISKDWGAALKSIIAKEKRKPKKSGWLDFYLDIQEYVSQSEGFGLVVKRKINGVTYYSLFLTEFNKNKPYHHAVLAHECLHLCQFHLPDFMDRNQESEFEAYTHTHLMNQFYENAL